MRATKNPLTLAARCRCAKHVVVACKKIIIIEAASSAAWSRCAAALPRCLIRWGVVLVPEHCLSVK